MRPLAAALALLLLALPATAAPRRVVSLNLCTDDYLALLAPGRAAALSPLARDPSLSVVAERAKAIPTVRPDAEAVLALHPDLVLAGPWGAQTTLAALAAAGIPIVQTTLPQDFPGIRAETERLARLLGAEAAGKTLLAAMDASLAALPPHPPLAALALEPRGYAAAPGTLADAVLRAAGYRNAFRRARPGLEVLAAHPPALLVVARSPSYPSLATDLLNHPVLAGIPRRSWNPALLACAGPWTAAAARQIVP